MYPCLHNYLHALEIRPNYFILAAIRKKGRNTRRCGYRLKSLIKKDQSQRLAALYAELIQRNTTKRKSQEQKKKRDKYKSHQLRTLLDSGFINGSVILGRFVPANEKIKLTQPIEWATKAGTSVTTYKAKIKFKLPEFDAHKIITWECFIDENTQPQETCFDLILGNNFLQTFGFILDYKTKNIE